MKQRVSLELCTPIDVRLQPSASDSANEFHKSSIGNSCWTHGSCCTDTGAQGFDEALG